MVVFVTVILVIITVLIHHEVLRALSVWLEGRFRVRPRVRLIPAVVGVLGAHVVEIYLFALGYYFLVRANGQGTLIGDIGEGLQDMAYFSFVTYASLGYGDVIPDGPLRFTAAMEVLTGLVMLAWTASFFYGFIQTTWRK